MKVTTNQKKVWKIFVESPVIHWRDISIYKKKIEVIEWSFYIEHITNPVTSVKKEVEHEDEATIRLKMKSLIVVRIEESNQWLPISR
jgi:hypothetical protein